MSFILSDRTSFVWVSFCMIFILYFLYYGNEQDKVEKETIATNCEDVRACLDGEFLDSVGKKVANELEAKALEYAKIIFEALKEKIHEECPSLMTSIKNLFATSGAQLALTIYANDLLADIDKNFPWLVCMIKGKQDCEFPLDFKPLNAVNDLFEVVKKSKLFKYICKGENPPLLT